MIEKDLAKQTTVNVSEKANHIWSVADIIGQGLYKPHEYGKVILPMTVIKPFNDTLLPRLYTFSINILGSQNLTNHSANFSEVGQS
jgi:type I restriction-modification system DNA methylase subunit